MSFGLLHGLMRHEAEGIRFMTVNQIEDVPLLYMGPPLSLVAPSLPLVPPLSSLVARIITSSTPLFFILHLLGNPTTHEWGLVLVAFSDSTALAPSCLQDGQLLVDFYTLHPADI
jgi:hypothetical protein